MEDIVVIGGGLMGSSTAWELSKYGEKVLLIEQQDFLYTFGSSFGEARISRSLGPKNDIFSYLQQRSVAEVKILIDFLNKFEGGKNHAMEDIYRTSPVTYIYYQSQQAVVDQLLEGQNDRYEYAANKAKALELFEMLIPDSAMIIREYKQYSGTLNPKVLIAKLHQAIGYAGGKISYNEKVTSLIREGNHFEIQITNSKTNGTKTIFSKKVVAAAGPYNGRLVADIAPYFDELITPKRLFLAFLKIKTAVYEKLSSAEKERLQEFYPVADITAEIYYSMIESYDQDEIPILKVGGHFLRTDIEDLDKVWQKELSPLEIEWSKKNTIAYLNMLNLPIQYSDLEFFKGYSCVYSLTESEIPYVTNVIKEGDQIDPNFILVGGMSGIGAKGSLTYGLLAADLLLKREETSALYQQTRKALGVERLSGDISNLSK